jgi:DNA modification methylase
MGVIAAQLQEQYTNMPIDTLIHGDALEVLKTFPDNFVDAIVADPPAGINFMNKEFDSARGGRNSWIKWLSDIMREARRVLKPGGHALIWSLPRTSHWTMTALEDAGFEIRDCLYNLVSGDTALYNFVASLSEEQQHAFMQIIDGQRENSGILNIFGSGFPKSLSIDKAIDRHFKAEREIIGTVKKTPYSTPDTNHGWKRPSHNTDASPEERNRMHITKPATPESEAWNGYGSALKPAVENWILVRKPLAAKSIAENVLEYGTGGLNIDKCRVGHDTSRGDRYNGKAPGGKIFRQENSSIDKQWQVPSGRFPSHLLLSHTLFCYQSGTKRVRGSHNVGKAIPYRDTNIFSGIASQDMGEVIGEGVGYADEDGMETVENWICDDQCPVRILDEQGGYSKSSVSIRGKAGNAKFNGKYHNGEMYANAIDQTGGYTDQGGPSRYFQQFPALDVPYIYAGKASRKDRNSGCEDIPEKQGFDKNTSKLIAHINHNTGETTYSEYHPSSNKNTHPTVKSQQLMRYLVKLVTPQNGIVLDMFAGSGSTLVAAIHEKFYFIGIEKEQEYVDIAQKRIAHAKEVVGRWE